MWIPRSERYYNEYVPQQHVIALGSEYENFSIPQAARKMGPYDPSTTWGDVWSDSLYVIPRLQNYADPIQGYYNQVVGFDEKRKP